MGRGSELRVAPISPDWTWLPSVHRRPSRVWGTGRQTVPFTEQLSAAVRRNENRMSRLRIAFQGEI